MLATSVRSLIEGEIATDRVFDDVTARLLGEEGLLPCLGVISAKENGVFCGESVARVFGDIFKGEIEIVKVARDGTAVRPKDVVVELRTSVATCLSAERTLLNTLSHMSGVATLTRKFVDAVKPHRARILATRKTLPGLREIQLLAVRAGGGWVHRRSLSDGILIKDNHLECVGEREILKRAREIRSPLHAIEIEVQSLAKLAEVLESPPDLIMLDNLSPDDMRTALQMIGGRAKVEASGGVSLETIGAIAALGVDYISVGALTHSVRALDLTMDIRQ